MAAKASTPQVAAFFTVALETGGRKGELQGLRWSDLDLDNGTLRFEQQFIETGKDGKPVFGPLKTGKSRRLDLSPETVALLLAHKRTQAELKMANRLHYVDHGLVFAQGWEHKNGPRNALGEPLKSGAISTMMRTVIRDAKVPRITVPELRHTAATLLLLNGEQPHVVQRWLGHTNITTTLNIYGHVLPSMEQDAARRMGTMLHGG